MKNPKAAFEQATQAAPNPGGRTAAESIRSHGSVFIRAIGSSMIPAIWPGEILSVRRVLIHEISEGEIVFYERGGRFFAHRAIRTEMPTAECSPEVGPGGHILTQGDALASPDPRVSGAELLGRVAAIGGDGKWREVSARPGLAFRIARAIVRRSTLAARVLLRFHARRRARDPHSANCDPADGATWGT